MADPFTELTVLYLLALALGVFALSQHASASAPTPAAQLRGGLGRGLGPGPSAFVPSQLDQAIQIALASEQDYTKLFLFGQALMQAGDTQQAQIIMGKAAALQAAQIVAQQAQAQSNLIKLGIGAMKG